MGNKSTDTNNNFQNNNDSDNNEVEVIFKEDTKTLGLQLEDLIDNFYPVYKTISKKYITQGSNNDLELQGFDNIKDFCFFKINECTIYDIEDKESFFAEKMQCLFTTAYSLQQRVCYGIYSNNGKVSLIIGTKSEYSDILKLIIEGILPGVNLEIFQKSLGLDKKYIGHISGIPACKIDGEYQKKHLSSIIRSLNNKTYIILVLCKPIPQQLIHNKISNAINIQDKCFAISKRTIAISEGISTSDTASKNKNTVSPYGVGGAIIGTLIAPGIGSIIGGLIGNYFGNDVQTGKEITVSKGFSEAVTEAINKDKAVQCEIQNGIAIELLNMVQSGIKRLKVGRSIGMWESEVVYFTDDKIAGSIINSGIYCEMASGQPDILPPVAMSFEKQDTNSKNRNHVDVECGVPYSFASLVTSEELCGICSIPVENIVGFEIKEAKGYSLNAHCGENDKEIGKVCEYEKLLVTSGFGLSEDDINKHVFVTGITGSGKTNSVKRILTEFDKPFLVIEPAKKEYRNLKIEKLQVFTLGRTELNCIKINPFYIMPGVSPQQHIDFLKDLFNASFGLYGPMPYILEKCLYRVYEKHGWNISLGFHPLLTGNEMFNEKCLDKTYSANAHRYLFPTMLDLKQEIDSYVEKETTYEGEVKGNIRGALQARIDSLCVGSKGFMFNTNEFENIGEMLQKKVVFELEGLADDADKAFALGMLLILISEYRQTQKEIDRAKGLKHILVIEEAHRLLKNSSTEKNELFGNSKGKAIEHFTNMLAEMRSYGQGVIIAEQIPAKLSQDVIKNTSSKIVHRLVAKDDQDIISNAIGVKDKDAIFLGNSKAGYALCHKEGMSQPVIVKITEIADSVYTDKKLYEINLEEKMQRIACYIIESELGRDVSICSVKTLLSIMWGLKRADLFNGINNAVEQIDEKLYVQSVALIPGVDYEMTIKNCIVNSIFKLLVTGVFSSTHLPDNELINKIKKCVTDLPKQEELDELKDLLETFYQMNPARKAVITVAGLFIEESQNGYCIDDAVGDYMLKKDNIFISMVKKCLKGGGED